jgi:hypothetical protein
MGANMRAAAARAVVALLGWLVASSAAYAQDRFEVQVYDSDTAPTGSAGLEVHVNVVTAGEPAAVEPISPVVGVTHVTFEPHLGVASWCELGGYLQTAERPDGTFLAAGAKLRLKLRVPHKYQGVGFAINFELSDVPTRFEPNQWGSEVRPILDVTRWGWYGSVNPILDTDLAGSQAFRPQFQPAAKLARILSEDVRLGGEYYGAFGSNAQHFLLAALDYAADWLDLNVGVGYGVAGPERWLLKMIVGLHPPGG